jgi:hypothetical protein
VHLVATPDWSALDALDALEALDPVCPVCGECDALVPVGPLLDAQDGPTALLDHATSRLAQRLLPPPRPKARLGRVFALGWLGSAAVLAVAVGLTATPGGDARVTTPGGRALWTLVAFVALLALTWVVGLVALLVARAVTAPRYAEAAADWDLRTLRLRDGSCCTRDKVVVESGQTYSPEGFVRAIYGA